MTNKERARFLLTEAAENLEELKRAFEGTSWNRVVRRSQEVVELSLKALFKLMNVEYPKVHDVAPVLEKILLQKGIKIGSQTLQEVKIVSKTLAEKRAPAFYGEIIYDREEAKRAKDGAEKVFRFAEELAENLE